MALEDALFHLHASQIQNRELQFAMLEEIYRKLAQFPIPPPIELGDLLDNVLLSSGFGRAPTAPMDIFNYIFVHEIVAPSIIILWADDLKEHDMVAIKDYIADFFHTKNFNAQHLKFTAAYQLFYSNWQALDLAFENNVSRNCSSLMQYQFIDIFYSSSRVTQMVTHNISIPNYSESFLSLSSTSSSEYFMSTPVKDNATNTFLVNKTKAFDSLQEPFSFNKNLPKDDFDIAPQKVNLETKKQG
ncbi:hypothetical protein E3N88_13881 [Mikania micrantha]|uniref:Uncharacterized protein n=1 Tax=Mikania micrantha TaxID=192012 RepID=A0A5N6P1J8_9ASTR|nr:hypothetical protein E3N88_13881 [Mikania micrantha]